MSVSEPLSERQHAYLKAMGIDVWVHKDNYVPEHLQTKPVYETPSQQNKASHFQSDNTQTSKLAVGELDWTGLGQQIKTCTACALHQTRNQAVVGSGNQQAQWMIVGEAPDAEEDAYGEPFAGHAGMLLNSMLRAIGLQRQQVYLTNVVKCRPPVNRKPDIGETEQCLNYLHRQIELVQPEIILVAGGIAAQQLLTNKSPLGRLRQKLHWLEPQRIPVVVTYHPAYLLQTPSEKNKAWQDLLFAQNELNRL